jgi:hypothetical protein
MKSAAWEVHEGIWTELDDSSTVITAWYVGDVPHKTTLPYGVIESMSVVDDSAQGVNGADHSITLNFYAATIETVMKAMAETIDILHLQTLSMNTTRHTAWCTVHDGFETTLREQDTDFEYSRGIQRWRVRTHYTST